MIEFLQAHYNWVKAFHIIAVMAWMAGLLYLPRLFVYHAENEDKVDVAATLSIMERRLLRIIMNPAMIVAWIMGLAMLGLNHALLEAGWMHVKLAMVVVMTALHHVFGRWRKDFAEGRNKRPAKFYRLWNEVPALVMIVIVIMAVAEPF
jgi:putative membrane protein